MWTKRTFLVFVFTEQTQQLGEALKSLTHLSQVALLATERLFIFALSLVGDHGRIVSGFRTNSSIYILFNLNDWLTDGRAAYRSANNVVCVYEAVPLTYMYSVIDRTYNKELFVEYDWFWLEQSVQANKLQVTSDGR